MFRILLALDSRELRELLRDLIEREPGFELVGEVADPIDLLLQVKQTAADAVVQEWLESEETPGIVSHLLAEYPDLLVIGVPPSGDHAFLCQQTITQRRFRTAELHDVLSEIRRGAPALK